MHSAVIFKMIILALGVLKATNDVKDDNKDEFIKSLNDWETVKCSICFESLLKEDFNAARDASNNFEKFMSDRSIFICPGSYKHIYHIGCLLPWFLDSFNCPLCRAQLPLDLFDKYVSNSWCNFYSLSKDVQDNLISQLSSMDDAIILRILEIFKSKFGERALVYLKNRLPNDRNRNRLINIIEMYERDDEQLLVLISNHLIDQNLHTLKEIFTPQKVSKLMPKDLHVVCHNLNNYCRLKYLDEEELFDYLNIGEMPEYSQKFSLLDLANLLNCRLTLVEGYDYLQDICYRMRSNEPFDEDKVLKFIDTSIRNDVFNPEYGNDFLSCIIDFYKIKNIEFFGRLLRSAIINKTYINEKHVECDLQFSFDFIIRRIDSIFENLDLREIMHFLLYENPEPDAESKANLIDFLILTFENEIRYDDDEGRIVMGDDEMEIEYENGAVPMQASNAADMNFLSENFRQVLEYIINDDIGDKFLEKLKKRGVYYNVQKFRDLVEIYEGEYWNVYNAQNNFK